MGPRAYHRKQGHKEDERERLHARGDEEGDAEAGAVDEEAAQDSAARPAKGHDGLYAVPPSSGRLHQQQWHGHYSFTSRSHVHNNKGA